MINFPFVVLDICCSTAIALMDTSPYYSVKFRCFIFVALANQKCSFIGPRSMLKKKLFFYVFVVVGSQQKFINDKKNLNYGTCMSPMNNSCAKKMTITLNHMLLNEVLDRTTVHVTAITAGK
jgi:hypothetical protein